MRTLLRSAIFLAVALAAGAPASAQVRLDTSSPDGVMTSLAGLHESWTHEQFLDFMRAAMMAGLSDDVEDPASWQENPGRWEFLPDTLAIFGGLPFSLLLVLEGEPLFDYFPSEEIGSWVGELLRHGLEGRTTQALVRFGRSRERAALVQLRKRVAGALRELEEQAEHAEADASRPGASSQDQYAFERQARSLANIRVRLERLDRRLDELEGMVDFAPGAIGCSLERGIDLSSEEAMLADLEALAKTCPQRVLIRFLWAAGFVAAVPAGLAEPGARMQPSALIITKDRVRSAMQLIMGHAALLQEDPLVPGVDSVPGRLTKTLDVALDGRTMSEVMDEGQRLERAFLTALREELSAELRSELEKRGRQSLDESAPPQSPSEKVRQLRLDIERIDRRLAMLESETPAPPPPGAN